MLPPIARRRAGEAAGLATSWPREQTLVIGDTPRDIACAHADDVRCIAVTTGPHGRDDLEAADFIARAWPALGRTRRADGRARLSQGAGVTERAAVDGGVRPGSGVCSGKWQAAWWLGPKRRSGGSTSAQISCASGQRVRKRQPEGGSIGLGSSPRMPTSVLAFSTAGSGTGIVLISACV